MFVACLLVALAACASPRDRCVRASVGPVVTLRTLVSDSRQILARGYDIRRRPVRVERLVRCATGRKAGATCFDGATEFLPREVSVDLDAERRKLAALEGQLRVARRRAVADVGRCNAAYGRSGGPVNARAPRPDRAGSARHPP